jgi:hypothetical protein
MEKQLAITPTAMDVVTLSWTKGELNFEVPQWCF